MSETQRKGSFLTAGNRTYFFEKNIAQNGHKYISIKEENKGRPDLENQNLYKIGKLV